jgi:hypothetical protein
MGNFFADFEKKVQKETGRETRQKTKEESAVKLLASSLPRKEILHFLGEPEKWLRAFESRRNPR